jgi:peptidoglycan/xylan/chitin deacetylase (PgdA/CDA1 family)
MVGININGNDITVKRAVYAVDILFSALGVPYEIVIGDSINTDKYSLVVTYRPSLQSEVLSGYMESGGILVNIRFSNQSIPSIPHFNEQQTNGDYLKLLQSEFIRIGKGYMVNVTEDIIASTFYLLSREEEVAAEKDQYGRFEAQSSLAYNSGFICRPVVNGYVSLLDQIINLAYTKKNLPLLQKMYWPGGKEFVVSLAHDIDWLSKRKRIFYEVLSHLRKVVNLLLSRQFKELLDKTLIVIRSAGCGKNPNWSIEEVMDLEERFGYRSTFYFLANVKNNYSRNIERYGTYNVQSRKIKQLIRIIVQRGWMIGLHGSYSSYNDGAKLASEKRILESISGKKITGIRQHFQRFTVPNTWKAQEYAGLEYDSTLGYSMPGFRASICLPFAVYDVLDEVKYKLIEIPFEVVDEPLSRLRTTVSASRRMQDFLQEVRNLIDTVKQYNGGMCLLWHPFEKYPGCSVAYEQLLQYLKLLGLMS